MSRSDVATPLLAWFDHSGRHDLPWQQGITPYRVWISEIMLQQTQVSTVIPYFERFMQRFPEVQDLAQADVDEVLHLWTGLGYYSRARNLHRAARLVCSEHGGTFPASVDALSELPGIGRSTAGAIASISMGIHAPILDGNVKRVLARLHRVGGWPGQSAVNRELWHWAEQHTPEQRVADYTQAIMDLGATVCTPRRPNCPACPLSHLCEAQHQGNMESYPGKKPRKTLPVQHSRFLIAHYQGEVLLERRDGGGVWQGLYCFPELGDSEAEAFCAERNLTIASVAHWPGFRHTFSHYHLDIEPVAVALQRAPAAGVMADDRQLWYNTRQPPNVGLAAPVKKLLATLTQGLSTLI